MVFKTGDIEVRVRGERVNVNLGDALGDFIYTGFNKIAWVVIATSIYKNEPVELDDDRVKELKDAIESDGCGLIIAIKVAVLDYLNA